MTQTARESDFTTSEHPRESHARLPPRLLDSTEREQVRRSFRIFSSPLL